MSVTLFRLIVFLRVCDAESGLLGIFSRGERFSGVSPNWQKVNRPPRYRQATKNVPWHHSRRFKAAALPRSSLPQ